MGCKRAFGPPWRKIAEALVGCGFPRNRRIRFTVPFRTTITIGRFRAPDAAASARLRASSTRYVFAAWCAADPGPTQLLHLGPGSAAHREERCAASRTRYDAPRGPNSDVECDLGNSNSAGLSSSAGNEGVGEHVRTRFHLGKSCR